MGRNQGIKSKNVVHPQYRNGAPNRAVRPAGVAQLGSAQGSHITEHGELPYRGISMKAGAAIASELGNVRAANCPTGVGGGRTIHKTGSQRGLVTRANNPRGRSFDD